MLRKKSKGFTLLELMIVVAVVAILASLAFYNYSKYTFRARRVDGKNLLEAVAAAQERIYSNFNAYASTVTGSPSGSPPGGLGFTSDLSDNGTYKVTVSGLGAGNQTYTLTATPQGRQADDKCKNLSITSAGVKSQTGDESNGKCW